MSNTFEMFIADSARSLVTCLNEPPPAQPGNRTPRQRGAPASRPKTFTKEILDASGAQRLESGNFILLKPAKERLDSWVVLVPLEFQRDFEFVEFRVRGMIKVAVDPAVFITKSYLYILNRPADADGMATYVSGLANGTLSHAELLVALVSSAEARSQYERLLVYPMAEGSALDAATENSNVGESDRVFVARETLFEPAD